MPFIKDCHDVFKAELEPLGFHRLKGTNYYGRLVNNEILHYVGFRKVNSYKPGHTAFFTQCGALSMYYSALDFSRFGNTGLDLSNYYDTGRGLDMDSLEWYWFLYTPVNGLSSITDAIKTTELMAFDYVSAVSDLKSLIDYQAVFQPHMLWDPIVMILSEDHDSADDLYRLYDDHILKSCGGNREAARYQNRNEAIVRGVFREITAERDRVYQDASLMAEKYAEAERRYKNNFEQLQNYGLIPKGTMLECPKWLK